MDIIMHDSVLYVVLIKVVGILHGRLQALEGQT